MDMIGKTMFWLGAFVWMISLTLIAGSVGAETPDEVSSFIRGFFIMFLLGVAFFVTGGLIRLGRG